MREKLKVLLIRPFNNNSNIQPALGLGYLASAVRQKCEVDILDCVKERIYGKKLINYIHKFMPDIVGIQIYTNDLVNIKGVLRKIKNNFPKIMTVGGGPHASILPKETLSYMDENLNFVFAGECEISFSKFIDKINKKNFNAGSFNKNALDNIEGLCWIKKGKVHINPPMLIENLNNLDFPAWDKIRPQTYPEAQHGVFFKNFPIAPIITGRGCPFNCTFCTSYILSGRKLRKRAVSNIIEEIELLKENFGINEIHIVDDNFSNEKDYVIEFCEGILKNNIKISWTMPNGIRVDKLDREMLLAMKRSGCYLVSVGIEFGSDRMLKLTKKKLSKEQIREGISLIRSIGLEAVGFFMIGCPGERVEEVKKTIDFALSLPLLRANFANFLALPGTEAYKEKQKIKKRGEKNVKNTYSEKHDFAPDFISDTKLKNLRRRAFLKFYLRPHILLKNILKIKSLRHFKFIFRRIIRIL